MLLAEQERILSSEQNLLRNLTQYGYTSSTFGLIEDYGNITVPQNGIVFFNFKVSCATNTGTSTYAVLYIGGIPVEAIGVSAGASAVVGGAVWMAQGTYDVQIQGQCNGGELYVSNMQVGFTLFNDCTVYQLQSTTQGGTIYLTPPTRMTPLGPLNEVVFCINVSAQAPQNQLVNFSSTPITVDGVQYPLDEVGPTSTAIGYAISGKLFLPLAVGVQHSISVTTGNSSATLYVSVIACPWILTTAPHFHQPVTLNITQLSTIYAVICPLYNDVFKECFVGTPKGINSGAASDYYGYASAGTGANVSFSFTFDSVNAQLVTFSADSFGGCIDNIGVDVE
jgi:hypothetical protein